MELISRNFQKAENSMSQRNLSSEKIDQQRRDVLNTFNYDYVRHQLKVKHKNEPDYMQRN